MTTSRTAGDKVRTMPFIGPAVNAVHRSVKQRLFPGSLDYWEHRYATGGTSGPGSENSLAQFKADVLNRFVAENGVASVIEFGCGDGRQIELAEYPRYLGLDVSPAGLRCAVDRFSGDVTKSFLTFDPKLFSDPARFLQADLALSLDVIYHLVEDDLYEMHLSQVFGAAERFVVLYASDSDTLTAQGPTPPHVRHRPVPRDVAQRFSRWRLRERVLNRHPCTDSTRPDTSFAEFLIYEPQK
ncbi:class I SAM-dependent methyltransferase [Streptomyces sp. NPDC059373]